MAWDVFYKNRWRALLIGTVFFLTGCDHEDMPKKQMFSEIRECKDAGMDYRILVHAFDQTIARIQCVPKS